MVLNWIGGIVLRVQDHLLSQIVTIPLLHFRPIRHFLAVRSSHLAHNIATSLCRIITFIQHPSISFYFLHHSLILRRKNLRLIHSELSCGRCVSELFIVLGSSLRVLRLRKNYFLLMFIQILNVLRTCDSLSIGSYRLSSAFVHVRTFFLANVLLSQSFSLSSELWWILIQ